MDKLKKTMTSKIKVSDFLLSRSSNYTVSVPIDIVVTDVPDRYPRSLSAPTREGLRDSPYAPGPCGLPCEQGATVACAAQPEAVLFPACLSPSRLVFSSGNKPQPTALSSCPDLTHLLDLPL